MNSGLYHIKPGVNMLGLRPEMAPVLDIVPIIFARKGYDCWVTCAVEPREGISLHPVGLAIDFDSSTNIPEQTGYEIAQMASAYLGDEYDLQWHGPRWHLHSEHDPK